ncbi:MAG: hypothetical protein ABEJ40_00755, partial [Haloarculaceae archaeon]
MGDWTKLGAVTAVLLLAVASVGPVVTVETAAAAGNQSTADGTKTLKRDAIRDVEALSAPRERHESARERARERLNASLAHYRGPVRADSGKLFTDDAVAVQALTAFAGTDAAANATGVAALVARADNRTARRELRDARRLFNESRDAIDNRGVRRSMEAHLDNAQRAYDRALRTLARANDSTGRRAIRRYARSIRRLRLTWRQAHFVVERVVERTNATMPVADGRDDADRGRNVTFDGTVSLSVPSRADPVRRHNGTVTRSVGVRLGADGPVKLDSLAVAVDGRRVRTRNLTGLVLTANRSLSLGARVALPAGGHRVRVTVTGNDGATTASETLLLDGDGLNATVENATYGTDPLDPDSDSTATDADESDDGTVDGREDFDGDWLGTLRELDIGTDPLDPDTDGDGLPDGGERAWTGTDPLAADSDGDGVGDAEEDPDGDGLTHAEELDARTPARYADVDADGWDDAQELANGTDPFAADTDDDGLLDGAEPGAPFETDPIDPDTDGDGVEDGNETYTTTATNETLGATVELTGEGNVAAATTVESPGHVRFRESFAPNATVGPFVDVNARANFTRARITLSYNESRVRSSEGNLSVYRFNETTSQYEYVNATVDPDADTVTANVSHFSTYTVMDTTAWVNHLRRRADLLSWRPGGPDTERIENWTFTDMPASIEGSNWSCHVESRGSGYHDQPADGGCEIEPGKDAIRVWERTTRERVLNRTTTLPADGPIYVKAKVTAHIQSSWSHAAAVLAIEGGDNETDIYRLENDWSSDSDTRTAVRRINVTEYAGETVTVSLRADARHTGGDYSWLRAHYVDFEVANETVATRDTDGDGIPDFREVKGVPLANGPVVTLDPTDNDTDGDGVPDGEEVQYPKQVPQEPPPGYAIGGGPAPPTDAGGHGQSLSTGYAWTS